MSKTPKNHHDHPVGKSLQRRAPLPWQRVKSVAEDPQAPSRVQTILDSPSYRQADDDVEFLNLDARA